MGPNTTYPHICLCIVVLISAPHSTSLKLRGTQEGHSIDLTKTTLLAEEAGFATDNVRTHKRESYSSTVPYVMTRGITAGGLTVSVRMKSVTPSRRSSGPSTGPPT